MTSLANNRKSAYILIGVLVFALLFSIFYYVIYPKMEESNLLKYQIADARDKEATLAKQLGAIKKEQQANKKSINELKTKVPLTRELSNILNSIEQVELVSETKVLDVTFNNYDTAVKESIQTAEQPVTSSTGVETQNQSPSTDAENSDNEEVVTPVSPITSSSLPETLKLMTMKLSISAQDKEEIRAFLKEVEVLPRIMRIDSVEYEVPNIDVQSSETVEGLEATVQLTVFYYEGPLEK